MMVMRPNSPFKTPPNSRGPSPSRGTITRGSPGQNSVRRNGASPNRRTSPDMVVKGKKPLVRSLSDRSIGSGRIRKAPGSRGSE